MKPISYARHRFPPDVIRHAVWLYLRFILSYRDVEDLLAERGLIVSNEAIRRWVLKFGPAIAKNLRAIRPKAYTEGMFDRLTPLAHFFRMLVEPALNGLENMLMLPTRDPSLLACGAAVLDGAALA